MSYQPKILIADDDRSIRLMLETGLADRLIADRPDMDELQRRYLRLILEENGRNRRLAAAVLNLDRRTIQRLIARYQLQGAQDPEEEGETEA